MVFEAEYDIMDAKNLSLIKIFIHPNLELVSVGGQYEKIIWNRRRTRHSE